MDLKHAKNEGWQLSKNCVQQRFKELLCLSQWTDCAFRVGTEKIEVIQGHKLIFAVTSPVFEALFYGPLADQKNQVISVPDIEPHTFHLFLSYIYSDEVNLQSIEEAGELLYVAKKYLVQPLMMTCLYYLVQHTLIRTLWDILYIAEVLNEEELFTSCFQIMTRYHYEIWNSETDNLTAGTLCRLLEEDHMNMTEGEVLSMVLDWTKKELDSRGLQDTPQARRRLLEDSGALYRIRFLALPLAELLTLEDILTEQELLAFKDHQVPHGFCTYSNLRKQVVPIVWRSTRELLSSRREMWVNRGEVVTSIQSSSRVLIFGFEVFTRLAQISDYVRTPAPSSSYRECFVVLIKDPDGKMLQKTEYDRNVHFNSSQCVNLMRPFWFEPNVKYTISISFIGGQYPICTFDDASSKGTKFLFEEVMVVDGSTPIYSSFIMSVSYAL
ncbi:BTB/POZ domain-containing protein 6 [Halyomorpha halys]|uniref:BTB/POZ domain-containing protein 6 n=1 Tax=Halyomorpha halys TaxID=286706 RepID=UPI0006D4E89B|nr:BTB/POZ domain-containing protein 6-like [Halyomorpha halys]XP_014270540.1 BTB/POZ domain-containing protein 6-like [Halyomorpha halys]XP_024219593.1 BTB/POZ domain-containing protein 6-like [Halyomorpha halys]